MSDEMERQIAEITWKRVRLIALAMLAAPALYVVVGLVFLNEEVRSGLPQLEADVAGLLFAAFATIAALSFALAMWLRGRLLSVEYATRRLDSLSAAAGHYLHLTVIGLSLAETSAVLGLVYFLLTGSIMRMMLLAAAGVAFSLVLLPSRSRLDAMLRTVQEKHNRETTC